MLKSSFHLLIIQLSYTINFFLVQGGSGFNRRCSEEKGARQCLIPGRGLKTSKNYFKCRCTTDLCNSSRRQTAGYLLSLVLLYNIFKMII